MPSYLAMFNAFSTSIIERLHGRKLPVLLAEHTGTTERTWRNRMQSGWNPSEEEIERFRKLCADRIADRVQSIEGVSAEEARQIVLRCPSWKAGTGLPTADLIFWFSPRYGEGCAQAIATAEQFDRHCFAWSDNTGAGDVEGARRVLIDALKWLRRCEAAVADMDDADELEQRIMSARDLPVLFVVAKQLAGEMLLHVMSSWDVEFSAGYFQKFEPYPLFALMMPRMMPGIEIDEGGRLVRDGRTPKQRIFQKSTARLFDFLAVLAYWQRHHCFPARIPTVTTMTAWFRETDTRIVSWRDETTRFTERDFFNIWRRAFGRDQQGNYIGAPLPLLVAAHLWSPLLLHESGKPRECLLFGDDYTHWWQRNLERLTATGLQWGMTPWPACLTGSSPG